MNLAETPPSSQPPTSLAPIEVSTTVVCTSSDGVIDAPDDIRALRKAASDLQTSAKKMQEKYFDLCTCIRERQISPPTVQKELQALGFSAPRIAEIKKVSFTSPTIFLEYKEKTIGFKLALKAARAEGKDASKTPQQLSLKRTLTFKDCLVELLESEYPVVKTTTVLVNFVATVVVHGRKYDVTISEHAASGEAPKTKTKTKKGKK